MKKKTVRDIELKGRKVIMRVDFNVPLEGGEITDDTRIRAALPTIDYVLEQPAALILMSHLGRPEGQRSATCSLQPAAERLSELIGREVRLAPDCVGDKVSKLAAELQPGQVLMLENTRFHAAEEGKLKQAAGQSDEDYKAAKTALKAAQQTMAKALAALADVYVNDAFGAAHRAHASTSIIADYMDTAVSGFLIEKELAYLVDELATPKPPFVVIMGGAKVSDKIEVLKRLIAKADVFIIGGAMANTFLLAQGREIGKSLAEADKTDLALEILALAKAENTRFLLPADTRHTAEFADDAATAVTEPWEQGGRIPPDREGIDIGDRAIAEFCAEIAKARTIFWNGPMGVFEKRGFDIGTRAIAHAVADAPNAIKIVGGGDSVTAVNQFGVADKMNHISTGGGASLELLEGKELPGIAALDDA